MKIFNSVKIKIETWEIVSEDSFEYDGPVVQCYTSGSEGGDSTSVDPIYNIGMLSLSEDQQAMAEEAFDYWKHGEGEYSYTAAGDEDQNFYNEFGKDSFKNPGMINAARKAWMKNHGYVMHDGMLSTKEWVPEEGAVSFRDVESEQNKANMSLIPGQTELERLSIEDQTKSLKASMPIREKLFQETLAGTDPRGAMNRAQAGVQHGTGLAFKSMKNQAFRNNVDPNSGAFAESSRRILQDQTAGIAAARTGARVTQENLNYDRLRDIGMMYGSN